MGPRRAVRINGGAEEYFAKANDNILVFAQIENRGAVANLDEILPTPGLDGIMIGPADLSASYGHLMDRDHQEVQDAMHHILEKCKEHHVPFGLFSGTLELAQRWIDRGGQIARLEATSDLWNQQPHRPRRISMPCYLTDDKPFKRLLVDFDSKTSPV